MNNSQQHRTTGAPSESVPDCLEAITEQARSARQHHLDDIVRRLGRGERLTAEQIYDTVRAQTLCTWWQMVARNIERADSEGVRPHHVVARFVAWITPYVNDPTPPAPATAARLLGLSSEDEFALEHLNRSLTLIRQGAARAFLAQAETLAPASFTEQPPSASTGQEATA